MKRTDQLFSAVLAAKKLSSTPRVSTFKLDASWRSRKTSSSLATCWWLTAHCPRVSHTSKLRTLMVRQTSSTSRPMRLSCVSHRTTRPVLAISMVLWSTVRGQMSTYTSLKVTLDWMMALWSPSIPIRSSSEAVVFATLSRSLESVSTQATRPKSWKTGATLDQRHQRLPSPPIDTSLSQWYSSCAWVWQQL